MAVQLLQNVVTTVAAGQLCQNVTHWTVDTSTPNLYQVAKAFNTGLETGGGGFYTLGRITNIYSADAFISSISSKVLKPTAGATAYSTFAVDDFVGALSEDIYAQSVSAVCRLFTPIGPDYTGRIFYPAVPADAILEGRFTEDYIAEFNLTRDALLSGVTSTDGNWKIVVARRPAFTWELVVHAQIAINPGTIRKRLIPV